MATQGRYCNGDPFVVNLAAGTGVKFTSITPASTVSSGREVNGAMLNPGEGDAPATQGFDSHVPSAGLYIAYDDTDNVDPGNTGADLVFAAGTEGAIVKAVSTATASLDVAENGRDRIAFIGAMTVCAVEPPTNAFRPGIAAPSKVSNWIEDDINWSYVRDLTLPASAPAISQSLQGQRWPLQTWHDSNDAARTVGGVSNHPDYGPEIVSAGATALLMANNALDTAMQRKLIVALVQRGIDVHARAVEGGNWQNGGGGTGNGRKFFLAVAARLLDDSGMASYLDDAIWTEDHQCRLVTASDVAVYDYEAGDEGMPEWMGNVSSGTQSRLETASYRAINTRWQPGAALALQLIGAKTIWANDQFFDYNDRIMERTFFNGSGTFAWALTLTGTNSPPQFHRDMWSLHRVAAGMPAIWDW